MDGYACLAILKRFHANDLGDILAVHRIARGEVGKGDEDTHAGIIGLESARKINTAF